MIRPAAAAGLCGLLGALLACGPAMAFDPVFAVPAEPTGRQGSDAGSYLLPEGPHRDGAIPGRVVEGRIERRAWRLAAPEATTLALLAPLRDQLAAQGWRTVFECETAACGGFDFRFALDVLPEPDMHVDLGDFRFLSAERGAGEALGLIVSRSAAAGFVQLTEVRPTALPPAPAPVPASPSSPRAVSPDAAAGEEAPAVPPDAVPEAPSDLGPVLRAQGRAVLSDLVFATGSAELAPGDFDSLAALAAFLAASPSARIALVGHTDTAGGLAANIDLSKRRAEAVRRRLIERHGVPSARLTAEGVGYLAPLAGNGNEEGRALNRRVEAVLVAE